MKKGKIDILVIAGGDPQNKSVATNVEKLLKILRKISNNIFLITHCDSSLFSKLDKQKIYSIEIKGNRFKQLIFSQILVFKAILALYRRYCIGVTIFAFGQDLQIIPMIAAKIVSKRVIIRSDGRPTTVLKKYLLKKYLKDNFQLKICLFKIIEEINYRLADIVSTECDYMIIENNFQKFKSCQVGNLFTEIDKFINQTHLTSRRYEIGFIGRLSREKGIFNFIEALKLLNQSLNILIIGDGEDKEIILDKIRFLKQSVEYRGWVKNNKLPNYLNKTKIMVVPSFKEGLPNIILESMSCGCIVLATAVGGIPGVIKDGETGFLLKNNSPEHIAERIEEILNMPPEYLEKISDNARALVEKEFTFEKAVERWKKIFEEI